MRSLRYIVLLLCPWFILCCEESFDWKTEGLEEPLLVVEALLTNEKKRHQVKLSLTRDDLAQTPEYVDNAFVFIHDGDTSTLLAKDPDQPGVYLTDSIRALFGKFYTLFIVYNQKEYFALATSSFGAPLEPLITSETEDGQLEYVYQESSSPSMTEVEIRWTDLDESSDPDIRAYYYTLNVIDINKVFAPDKEKIIFPKGAQVTRKKYSLTQNHQDFLRSLLSETDWRGGLFDVAPGNVNTNLSEGAVGYFAVSMVSTDVSQVE
ncbi:MAG: DUF4249 family protein [Reichenbachiella sp.]|uniref:DUF4249 family protein n=1 Tax=Reichenbachiella sp. TaxID=2184521 RepID=UPI003267E773